MRTSERLITFILGTIFILSLTNISEGAEFKIEPSITVSEEYNDNIFLQEENRLDDYITRVMPSIKLEYIAPRWEWDLAYAFDYRYYAKGNVTDDITHALEANGHIEILNEFFFVDISDKYRRESLDVTRDFTAESLFFNQSDVNRFTVNPYFVLRPTSTITMTTGYIFEDLWYKEEVGTGRRYNIGYLHSVYEVSPKVTFNADYEFINADTDLVDYDKHDISFGSRYVYYESSYLFFTVGNSWLDFERVDSYSQIFWHAGIKHDFSAFTGSLESTRNYSEVPDGGLFRVDKYEMLLSKTIERASLDVSIFFKEFWDAVEEVLETRKYGTSNTISYDITPRTTGKIGFTAEKLEEKISKTYTRRYFADLRFDHTLSEGFTLAFEYRYADSDSPKILEDNYKNNRFILTMSKSF